MPKMSLNELKVTESKESSKKIVDDVLNKIKKGEKVEEKDIVSILKAHSAVLKTALDVKEQQDVDNLTDYLLNDAEIYKGMSTKFPQIASINDSLLNNLEEKSPNK